MPSKVDVANTALDRLGQPPIVSFDDGSATSNLVKRLYPIVREQVHRMHPWRRLKARARLAADVTAPQWGYTTRYPLPADTLMLLDVYKGDYPMNAGWELEGGYILTDESGPIDIRYIKDSDDPNEWDSLHVSACAWLLAAEMAEALTQDPTKRSQCFASFNDVLRMASRFSGMEGNPVPVTRPDPWEKVRYAGGTDVELRDITLP